MASIFILGKYGLSTKVLNSVYSAGFSLLDFLILDNRKIYSEKISNLKREKVFVSLRKLLSSDNFNVNIFDDLVMLNAVGRTVPTKVFRLSSSISELKDIMNGIDRDGISITDSRIIQTIEQYENLILNSEEKLFWDTFIYFLQNTKVSVEKLNEIPLDLQIIQELKNLNVIFESNDEIYLNIDNLFYKEGIIKKFELDTTIIPIKENTSKKLYLEDYLKMEFKDKDMFILRINGFTLQKIADEKGITRERVRQRLEKVKNAIPKIVEADKFGKLFKEFDISKDIFINVFNLDEKVYNFLSFIFPKGDKNFIYEILHGDYPESAKEYVLQVSRKVKFGVDVKIATKQNALDEILKENRMLQEYINKDELFYLYNEYVKDYPKLKSENQRSLLNIADRSLNIIKSSSKGYRFYDMNLSEDTKAILKEIITNSAPGAYNMDFIYKRNIEFMNQINIMNGSELHNLYFKLNLDIPHMVLGRNPEFILKITSKKDFLFNEMKHYDGQHLEKFVDYINSNFGILKQSLRSYLSMEFEKYINNQIINIDKVIYSDIHRFLKHKLIEKIYLRDDFEKIIKNNSNVEEISNLLIHQLGFRSRGIFIVSNKYSSVRDAMISIILSEKIINIQEDKIYKTQDFMSVKNFLEKEYKIIKIGENEYINTQFLEKRGFDLSKFKSFVRSVERLVPSNSYFTVKSLLNDGLNHELINDGFELITLDRILFTSNLFNSVTISFPTLYYKGDKRTVTDFLLDLLLEYDSVNLEDFIDDINEKYGLNFEEEKVKYKLIQEGIFYSKDLNKVYIYKEDYLDEVYGK